MNKLSKIILATGILFSTSCISPGGPRYYSGYNSLNNYPYSRNYPDSRDNFLYRAGPQIYSPHHRSPSIGISRQSPSYGRHQSYRSPQSHNSNSDYRQGSSIKHYNSSPSARRNNSPSRNSHSGRR